MRLAAGSPATVDPVASIRLTGLAKSSHVHLSVIGRTDRCQVKRREPGIAIDLEKQDIAQCAIRVQQLMRGPGYSTVGDISQLERTRSDMVGRQNP